VTDLLRKSSEWLEDQRTKHTASTVEYVRGDQCVEIAATVGKTTFEVDEGHGVLVQHESRDFLLLAAELRMDAVATLPQRGDRIRETQGSVVYVYEVLAPGKEPCWRWSDPYRKTLRIHSKQIATEGTP